MAGATPFLEQTARPRPAGRHPTARPEGVHLRRRLGVAVADPQCRGVFRRRGRDPGVRLDRGARHDRRRARSRRPRPRRRHRRPRRHRRHQAGRHQRRRAAEARSARADRRCWSATCIPRTRPTASTPTATSAPAISAAGSTASTWSSPGRAKDIIIRNGENISPKEVEDLLIGHPDIAEVAIVGLPDAAHR